ncbi:SPW repeat domain-containing protein [Tautonia plasticadhaerens]|uniref:SPW repeat protein n=1 Tax=Tautonia plasticadhaerens TaxID=2527974 RepID=A0A518GXU5_9BACT|nr:SPW repeat protein [Tautonia plasticadhaerens]QDV33418.1 SPW repeat protein [Tautonia plasticadhaerens]
MWAQVINTAIGIWLMAAPAVLGYGGAAALNDRIAGPIVATFAAVAVTEATRGARLVNLPIGLWMVVAPWALGGPTTAVLNGMVVGGLLVGFASIRGRIRERFGGGWVALFRADTGWARLPEHE